MTFASVCSGIEAATVAWAPLGWQCTWLAEIDPFCCKLLKHHYPEVPNHGDFTKIPDAERVDVLIAGTPCQSFSVAGKRAGLDDPRGNLTLEFLRLAGRIKPRWIVWENVPGILSIDEGRTFGAILGFLGQLGYGFAYRVLDAQYFRVPQRRRRVFVVGHLGDWRRAAAVLFERESLRWNSPPGREKGEEVAGSLGRGSGAHGWCDDTHRSGALSEDGAGRGTPLVFDERNITSRANRTRCEPGLPVNTLHATPMTVVIPILEAGARTGVSTTDPRAGIGIGEAGDPMLVNARQDPVVGLQPLDGSGYSLAVAFNLRGREGDSMPELSDTASVRSAPGGSSRSYVVGTAVRRLTPRECERLQGLPDDYTLIPTHRKKAKEHGPEAEALLAYYHRTERGRTYVEMQDGRVLATPDGPRYKAIGNSFPRPVISSLGERIMQVERIE